MSHCSIAIIKKRINYNDANTGSQKGDEFEFLVFEKGEIYHFLEIYSLAVNGVFDYTKLEKEVYKILALPQDSKFESKSSFKKSDKDNSTAYEFILSATQASKLSSEDKLLWIKQSKLDEYKVKWKPKQRYIFEREDPFKIREISNSFRADLRNIIEAKNKGRLVIFAGAGVSVDSGLPSWVELIEQLKAEMNTEQKDRELIAQEHLKERGKTEYNKRVREILKHKQSQFNPLHQKIVELNPLHIITTNYDELFEEAIKEKGTANYSIIRQDSDLPYAESSRLMIKMHGDLECKNFVLTQKDYKKYSKKFPLIESTVKSIFASKLVVFVGFSYDDNNLQRIIKTISYILKGDTQKPYLILPTDEIEKSIENIHVVKLDSNDLEKALEYRSRKNPIPKSLKPKGEDIFKFLDILKYVDINTLINESYDVEQHLVNQLDRFKELPFIPYQIIEDLTPFKILSKSEYDKNQKAEFSIRDFRLKTQNENLLEYLEKQQENGKIEFKSTHDKHLSENENKLNNALSLLNRSVIYPLIRKGDTNPIHYPLEQKDATIETCSCYRCCDDNFNYKLLLENLNKPYRNEKCNNDFYKNEMLVPYGLFAIGQSKAAYYELENVKKAALNKKRFITYYIALINQTNLRYCLKWFYDFKYTEEINEVKNGINEIDLEEELYNLNVDDDIKKCLKTFRDNSMFNDLKYQLDTNFKSILEMYEMYKTPDNFFYKGPNYYYNFNKVFSYLALYYHTNTLFFIDSFKFDQIFKQYLEASLASFQTNNKYTQKLKKLNGNFVYTFIKKASIKENISLLKKYKVTNLVIYQDENADNIIEKFNNLIDSGLIKHDFTIETFVNEELKYNLSISNKFENKLANEACNFLLLFSYLNLSEYHSVDDILRRSIDFNDKLKLYRYDFAYLDVYLLFIENYLDYLSEDTLLALFEKLRGEPKLAAKFICIVSKNSIFELGEEKTKKIIEQYMSKGDEILDLLIFYKIFDRKGQTKIKELLVKRITHDKEKNPSRYPFEKKNDILAKAYKLGIWEINKDKKLFKVYLKGFERLKEISNEPRKKTKDHFSPYSMAVDAEKRNNRKMFYRLIKLIYKEVLFENETINDISANIQIPKYKWILNPEKFDYNNFEVSWLTEFYNKFDGIITKNIIAKFKQIPNIEDIIKKELKQNFNEKLAELFVKEFVVNKPK